MTAALDLEHSLRVSREACVKLTEANASAEKRIEEAEAAHEYAANEVKRLAHALEAEEAAHAETRRQLEEARRELTENEGVIAVWRGRTERTEADAQRAVLEEREACAALAEVFLFTESKDSRDDLDRLAAFSNGTVRRIAAAIRAREAQGTEGRHAGS